jgi:hypothetical protein
LVSSLLDFTLTPSSDQHCFTKSEIRLHAEKVGS